MTGTARFLGGSALLFVASMAPAAHGYVRARDTATGKPLRWRGSEVVFTLSAPHAPRELPGDAVASALLEAAARWTGEVGCTALSFRVLPPAATAERARRDGVNAILFHSRTWCRDGVRSATPCYEPDEEAVTTTYVERDERSSEGWIVEADIEINEVAFRWSTERRAPAGRASLTDLLTHELGHVLGLAHSCDDGTLHPRSLEDTGKRPPRCPGTPPPLPPAMFPEPRPLGGPALLAPDERRAVCEVYGGRASGSGAGARGCGCAVGGPDPSRGGWVGWVVLAVAGWVGVRRRARPSPTGDASGLREPTNCPWPPVSAPPRAIRS